MRSVQAPVIPFVADLIRKNPGTISLGQGVVHYPPPAAAIDRMSHAVTGNIHQQYGHVAGLPALLEALREKLASENGIDVNDRRKIVVTAGGNMAFVNAVLAIADPGDEIILQTPYYFNHEMAVRMANCTPVAVPTSASYMVRPDAIEKAVTDRTRAVVTISPNNPTGAVYDQASLTAVNKMCRERGIYHITDEAYEYFTYDDAAHFSPGSLDGSAEHTISLFSFSKAYGMAGLRMGFMVLPAHLFEAVKKIQDTILICPPVANQHAALGALEAGAAYCRPYIRELAGVRDLVVRKLAALGDRVDLPPMEGAFYGLLRVQTSMDDLTIVRRLIEDYGVAVIPGSTFGALDGCNLRIAYGALQKDTVAAAMERLANGLGEILG